MGNDVLRIKPEAIRFSEQFCRRVWGRSKRLPPDQSALRSEVAQRVNAMPHQAADIEDAMYAVLVQEPRSQAASRLGQKVYGGVTHRRKLAYALLSVVLADLKSSLLDVSNVIVPDKPLTTKEFSQLLGYQTVPTFLRVAIRQARKGDKGYAALAKHLPSHATLKMILGESEPAARSYIAGASTRRKEILKARLDKNVQQTELAKKLGVTRAFVSLVECDMLKAVNIKRRFAPGDLIWTPETMRCWLDWLAREE